RRISRTIPARAGGWPRSTAARARRSTPCSRRPRAWPHCVDAARRGACSPRSGGGAPGSRGGPGRMRKAPSASPRPAAARRAGVPGPEAKGLGRFAALCRGEWGEDASLRGRLGDWARGRFTRAEAQACDLDAVARTAASLAPLLGHLCALEPLRLGLARQVLGDLLAEVEARDRKSVV